MISGSLFYVWIIIWSPVCLKYNWRWKNVFFPKWSRYNLWRWYKENRRKIWVIATFWNDRVVVFFHLINLNIECRKLNRVHWFSLICPAQCPEWVDLHAQLNRKFFDRSEWTWTSILIFHRHKYIIVQEYQFF